MRLAPLLKPGDAYAHGTRARYLTGCVCEPCTQANTAYARQRAKARAKGDENPLVDAAPLRAFLLQLQQKGVGIQRIGQLACVPWRGLWDIRAGLQAHVRKQTADRVLNIQPSYAKGQRINAYRTKHLLACLQNEGYTRANLAQRLGLHSSRLHLHHESVTVRNALKVRGLFACLTGEDTVQP